MRFFKKTIVILALILVLAAGLRLFQLGSNPPSLDWDEASLGYNAYSLLKTGKDEYGRVWPISIRSFGDFKPAMYTYLTIPSVFIFGLTEFAIRFPSALMGTLTVLVSFLLIRELFSNKVALLGAFLLAISPWHVQFSRVAFESNISLFFVFGGFWCFLNGIKKGIWFIPASVLLALSFYSYHSPRLVAPLIALGWAWYFRKQIIAQYKWVVVAITVFAIILIPLFHELFTSGNARFSSVTVLNPEGRIDQSIARIERAGQSTFSKIIYNRRVIYALAIARGYLDHFNLDFLFLTGDAPDRHHGRDMGMLYLWEAPFILIGIITLLRRKDSFPLLWWFLVAPAASAITTGTPHAVRALLLLPTYQIFTAIGLLACFAASKKLRQLFVIRISYVVAGVLIFCNVFYYFQMYYIHTPIEASQDWQYGYKQAVTTVLPYEKEVDRIVMTYRYDQPYVFVLLYGGVDPAWYQSQWGGGEIQRAQRSFGKYEFRNIDWKNDQYAKNTIFVGTPSEIPDGVSGQIAQIPFLDGTIAFRVVKL